MDFMCGRYPFISNCKSSGFSLDDAVLRSCRIDKRFELDYADEYQTKSIFEMMLPNQKENFQKFYKKN